MTTTTTGPDPPTTALTNVTFSYLDIAACILGDWQTAYPEESRDPEEVADAILGSFSIERLRAVLLAHLVA